MSITFSKKINSFLPSRCNKRSAMVYYDENGHFMRGIMATAKKQKLKILVASAEVDWAEGIICGFERAGFQSIGYAASAPEVLSFVERKMPDVLVTEPYLPGMNCDELTSVLEERGSPFLVKVAVSSRKQDLLANRFLAVGGDLFRIEPIDYVFTADQIYRHLEKRYRALSGANAQAEKNRKGVAELLRWFGMPLSANGFSYITEAVVLGMEKESLLDDMKNRMYPIIAVMGQTNINCVERCIRSAIENTFRHGNAERLYQNLTPDLESGKLSNREFIHQIIAIYQKTIG